MADSWEQHAEEAPKTGLNPAAATFSFNPSAGSFVPGVAVPATAAPVQEEEKVEQVEDEPQGEFCKRLVALFPGIYCPYCPGQRY